MRNAYIIRQYKSDHGTRGTLRVPSLNFKCFTMELPDRENQSNISRIPPGVYVCRIRHSPRFGKVFHLQDVEGRTYILIHAGNFGGDVSKGLKSHTHGCILLGKKRGTIKGQKAILVSKPTIRKFMNLMGDSEFTLTIIGG